MLPSSQVIYERTPVSIGRDFREQVSFISKGDLIENKRQIGRLINLADVEQLTLVDSSAEETLTSALGTQHDTTTSGRKTS